MCWMRVLSTTMVLVKWVDAMKPLCVGHHCVVIQSLHRHHPTMCVHRGVCRMRCAMCRAWPMVCECCGWRRLVALVVGCMALPSTCVPLCHSSQMALTTHAHFLLHSTVWMVWRPGDLPSCIGRLFCDHSFPFPFPSQPRLSSLLSHHHFFLTSISSWMIRDDLWDEFDKFYKCHILLSSHSSGWWFECFNSVKSRWNRFSSFALFVWYHSVCERFAMPCSIIIVVCEYCLIHII